MSKRSAKRALRRVVRALVSDIEEGIRPALADEPDAVHQLRTSVRRLRGVLAAYDSCFADNDRTAAVRAGLADSGTLLGVRRDAEVRVADIHRAAASLGLHGSPIALLAEGPSAVGAEAQRLFVGWAHGAEARRFVSLLGRWADDPDFAGRADKPAKAVLAAAVRRERHRVLGRARVLSPADEAMAHDLRKAARRLRHVADAAVPSLRGRRRQLVTTAGQLGHDIQSMLGDHRDALLLADHAAVVAAGCDPAARASVLQVEAWAHAQSAGALLGLPAAVLTLSETDEP